ncbi:hypothetical protein ACOME3_005350 [Neoechinorhynchus agilis]
MTGNRKCIVSHQHSPRTCAKGYPGQKSYNVLTNSGAVSLSYSTSSGYSSDHSLKGPKKFSSELRHDHLSNIEVNLDERPDPLREKCNCLRKSVKKGCQRIREAFPSILPCAAVQIVEEEDPIKWHNARAYKNNYNVISPSGKYRQYFSSMILEASRYDNQPFASDEDILCDLEVRAYFFPSEVKHIEQLRRTRLFDPVPRKGFIRSTLC